MFRSGHAVCLTIGLFLLTGNAHSDPPQTKRPEPRPALPQGAILRLGTLRSNRPAIVDAVAFSPDGKLLAGGEVNGRIRLWDASTGQERLHVVGHQGRIALLVFSPDSKRLVSVGEEQPGWTLRLWDSSGKELRRWGGAKGDRFSCPAFSPDGKLLAFVDQDRVVNLWQTATELLSRRLRGLDRDALCLRFSADGKHLWAMDETGTTVQWDPGTGKQTRRLRLPGPRGKGKYLAALSAKGQVAVARSGTIALDHVINPGTRWEVEVPEGLPVAALTFSPDGRTLASTAGEHLTLRVVKTGKWIHQFDAGRKGAAGIAFSPDDQVLAIGRADGGINRWDVRSGSPLLPFGAAAGGVSALDWSPDGRTLATGTTSGMIRFWAVGTGRETRGLAAHADRVEELAFSPDGRLLASACKDGTVKLWETASGKQLRAFSHVGSTNCVAFSPSGALLGCGGGKQGWNTPITLWDVAKKQTFYLPGHRSSVQSLAFLPDGDTLVSAGGDFTIRIWSIGQQSLLRTCDGNVGTDVRLSLSADGRSLASTGMTATVRIWEVLTGKLRCAFPNPSDTHYCVTLSPDGRLVAAAGACKTVGVWDVATGKQVAELRGHQDHVFALAFSPDGRVLASGSPGGTALLWEVAAPALAPGNLADWQLAVLWADLSGEDVKKAHRATWELVAARGQIEQFLQGHLDLPSEKQIAGRIADLDHDRFRVRQAAEAELLVWGEEVIPALKQTLAGKPSLEVRRRIERLLGQVDRERTSRLRVIVARVVETLEKRGTPMAKQALEQLKGRRPGSWLASEASAALRRMRTLPQGPP